MFVVSSRWIIVSTSRHWCIHEHGSHFLCCNCHFFWDSRIDSWGVNQQCSLLHLPNWIKKKHRIFFPTPSLALSTWAWGCKSFTKGQSKRKAGSLEDAIWSCVNLQDIRSGREHCEDAVCSLRYFSWRVHYLNIGETIEQINSDHNTFPEEIKHRLNLHMLWRRLHPTEWWEHANILCSRLK